MTQVDAKPNQELEQVTAERDLLQADLDDTRIDRDRHLARRQEAEAFRRVCYEIVGEVNGYRDDEVLAVLGELQGRAELAESAAEQCHQVINRQCAELAEARNTLHRQGDQIARQRSELQRLTEQHEVWVARTVRAEDVIAAAAAEDHAEPEPPPGPIRVPVSLMARCGRCGRNLATHWLIHDHRFQPATPGGRTDAP